MKKLISILVCLVMAVAFVACGGSDGTTSTTISSSAVSGPSSDSEYYFRDGTLVSRDVKIVITDWKVIPVGEVGNEYGEKPVIAFWYDITNLSGSDSVTPMSWITMFAAIQDNDPDKVNELNVGMHPDSGLLDDQSATIKEGGTLAGAIAYELSDEITPVVLKATRGLAGEELGEQTFDISEYEFTSVPDSGSDAAGMQTIDFHEITFEVDAQYRIEETDENTRQIELEDGVAFVLVTREQGLFDAFFKNDDETKRDMWASLAASALISGLETQNLEGADTVIAGRDGYSSTFFVKTGETWGSGAAIAVPGNESGYCLMFVDTSGNEDYTEVFAHIIETLTIQ